MKRLFPLFVLLAFLLTACGSPSGITIAESNGIEIVDAWARPAFVEGGNGAVYMVIRNTNSTDDILLSVSSSVSDVAEIHETYTMDPEEEMSMSGEDDMNHDNMGEMPDTGPMMGMRQLENVTVPADGEVTFEVGGKHVMLVGVTERLAEGDIITLTLAFQDAGDITFDVEIREE